MNTSATGGFLQVSGGQDRVTLEDVLHDFIAGVTGLGGNLVRPRWQASAPRVPGPDAAWCAFGIVGRRQLNFPVVAHVGDGDGHDEITVQEELTVLASFYGPSSTDLAVAMRDGAHLEQNRAGLRPFGIALTRADSITEVPEVHAAQWLSRSDLVLIMRRETTRQASVLNIVRASGSVATDAMSVPTGCEACQLCQNNEGL